LTTRVMDIFIIFRIIHTYIINLFNETREIKKSNIYILLLQLLLLLLLILLLFNQIIQQHLHYQNYLHLKYYMKKII